MKPHLPLVLTAPLLLTSCGDIACFAGLDACVLPSPCPTVAFTCDAGFSEVRVITDPSEVPGGVAALGAPGDILLANDQVVAVIDALDHPHYLAPTGGSLIDLSLRGANDDALRQMLQASGLLPDDAARYTDVRLFDDGDVKAVQVTGELDGRPGMRIATRYEIRPCEPGIRVRTELYHGGDDPITVLLADGWYLGDRGHVPFTPAPGAGFSHPSFGLTNVSDVLVDVPFLVAGAHPLPGATYSEVACNVPQMDGFHSDIISVVGPRTRVLAPRDYEVFERFIAVSSGPSVAGAADIALGLRTVLHDEPMVEVTGRLTAEGDPRSGWGWPGRAQVILAEGTEADGQEARTPWTHVVPGEDGTFRALVPAGRTYTVEVEAFGQLVTTAQVDVGTDATQELGSFEVPVVGELRFEDPGDDLLVIVQAAGDVEKDALMARFLGTFETCAPLLGHPHGGTPACDRVLVQGQTSVLVPPGTYDLHAVRGPFSTLARQTDVVVDAGASVTVSLAPQPLDMVPEGWVSADFHVHGAASFDAGIPDAERVATFAAAGMDVIVTSEHDVVSNLKPFVASLGLDDRLRILDGTESTGHILFDLFEDASFPKVIGHFNLFPMPYDPAGPYRGAPWDELAEPGVLYERALALGWPADLGVAQLNHPWGGFQFGRDFGWAESIALDLTKPLPATYDGSGPSLFLRTPEGATRSNADYHAQEVMNGSANKVFEPYRAIWFYVLEQGLPRAGTANSDTHSLTENVVGFPRTLVRLPEASFTEAGFLTAVRDGRMIGTNGPLLDVRLAQGGDTLRPSLTPLTPAPGTVLAITVDAAPWIPVDEVRVIVNGQVVRTITELTASTDELGDAPVRRLDTTIALDELLPDGQDAWIVVEAGSPLVGNADLDCNGVPDTGDNNGDGRIDAADVDGEPVADEEGCLDTVGPLAEPTPPARGQPGHAFSVVVPGGHPMAFSNPFLVDVDGQGWTRGTR